MLPWAIWVVVPGRGSPGGVAVGATANEVLGTGRTCTLADGAAMTEALVAVARGRR